MAEITLFGFGDDCPPGFENNKRQITVNDTQGIQNLLKAAGFDNLEGLVLLVNNKGIALQDWPSTQIKNTDTIKILSAIEGG